MEQPVMRESPSGASARRPLNILQIIVQNKLRSGGAIQLFLLARELVRRGHRVCAVYNGAGSIAGDFDVFAGTGIDLRFLDMGRLTFSKRSLDTVRSLRRLVRDEGFDLIHAHKGNAVDLSWCATLGMDIPIITNRGVNIPLGFFQSMKYRTPKIKRVVAVSQAVKDVMVLSGHIPPDKIAVVYGSVDTARFHPGVTSAVRSGLGLDGRARVIGFVGNPNPRKGLAYLLDAFVRIADVFPDTALVLLGVTADDVRAHPAVSPFMHRIHALGFRKDVPECLAACDLFVFPGIQDEGLTGTVREAAAMGLPVITTDVAGNTELIAHGETGLVVPVKDASALADAIRRLLGNPDEAARFGQNARAFVDRHMRTDVRAKMIEAIYYEALGEHPGMTPPASGQRPTVSGVR